MVRSDLVRANEAAPLIGVDERTFCDAVELAGVSVVFDKRCVAHFRRSDLAHVRVAVDMLPKARLRFVYVVRSGKSGPFKIGMAFDVDRRVMQLQTTSPRRLRLVHAQPGSAKLERIVHRALAAHRRFGEWFNPHAEVAAFVALAKKVGIEGALAAR